LEQNYRSTQTIVDAASRLIAHNKGQIPKDVYSRKAVGEPIDLLRCYSDIDEAALVMKRIKELHNRCRVSFDEMAVLYRTNAQSRSFEEVLRKNAVPYRIYGGMSFYQRKEIKDVIAYFRLAVNPHDEEALRRVINYPARGIGDTTFGRVCDEAKRTNRPLWDVLASADALDLSSGAKKKLRDFYLLIQEFNEASATTRADVLSRLIVDKSRIREEINKGRDPEDISRQENLQELMDNIASFTAECIEQNQSASISHYLQEVSLLSDVDDDNVQSKEEGVVTLMTIHAAKGLEFRAVFVVGMEEELFPSPMALETPMGLEEERRLCYVAMTRAEEFLTFTTSKSRFRYGKVEQMEPSRFLQEIGLYGTSRREESHFQPRPQIQMRRPVVAPAPAAPRRLSSVAEVVSVGVKKDAQVSVVVGDVIVHERFGRGRVIATADTGMDAKATVEFENAGVKQLLLRFAKFTKAE
jgi:DNA helicase-2/ATP-dependent DNA helicase PcrA